MWFLYVLYILAGVNSNRIRKSLRLRCARRAARIGAKRNLCIHFGGKPHNEENTEELGVNTSMILKSSLKNWDGRLCTSFI
jgi:hypothetical protein